MSIPLTKLYKRIRGFEGLLGAAVKSINLKPLKNITFTFDPFDQDANTIRRTMHIFNLIKVRETNLKCLVKNNVVCDRSDPTAEFELSNGKILKFHTANLNTLEVIEELNKYALPLVPPPDESEIPKGYPERLKSKYSRDKRIPKSKRRIYNIVYRYPDKEGNLQ